MSKIELTEYEINLVYTACMSMCNKLTRASNELNGFDKLQERMIKQANEYHELAKKIK